jgi:DNA processing protein
VTPGAAGPVGDDDRLARAGLSATVEPGDLRVARAVRADGAVAVWQRIRRRAADPPDPRRSWDSLRRLGGRLLCPGDPEWPAGLADLAGDQGEVGAEPFALWLCGPARLADVTATAVAVVGSRAATGYGLHVAGLLAEGLVGYGRAVVSGGAYGVDGAAHRGALAVGGPTVAVLAGGVDILYPRGHDRLLRAVAERGAVVSEVPPGTPPLRRRFLSRNRLIAALTLGTVVVEAGVRSGALRTLRDAHDLGRSCLLVPGPVTSPMSAGCHQALRDLPGARPVTRAAEIHEEVGPLGALAEPLVAPAGPRDGLTAAAHRVLEGVPARIGGGPAEIAARAGVDVGQVLSALGPLLDRGRVERDPAGYRLTRLGRAPAAAPAL